MEPPYLTPREKNFYSFRVLVKSKCSTNYGKIGRTLEPAPRTWFMLADYSDISVSQCYDHLMKLKLSSASIHVFKARFDRYSQLRVTNPQIKLIMKLCMAVGKMIIVNFRRSNPFPDTFSITAVYLIEKWNSRPTFFIPFRFPTDSCPMQVSWPIFWTSFTKDGNVHLPPYRRYSV